MPRVSQGPRKSEDGKADVAHAEGDRDQAEAPLGLKILKLPKATNVIELAYSAGSLVATFRKKKGGLDRYLYEGVPEETFEALRAAGEKQGHAGHEFATLVVAKYKGVKLPPEAPE